ncbi:MAG: phosphotransferase [Acidimicrobiales bacterium]
MEDVVDEVGRLMPGWRAQSAVKLRGSTRNVFHRLAAIDERARPVRVVAKQYPAKVQASVREAAALAVLAPGLPAPRLLAERADPPLLVMSDVGAGQNVADALLGLGSNADLAEEAVCDWAGALGALHARTLGVGAAFAAEIDSRAGELAVPVDPTPGYLIAAAGALNDRSAEVGVAAPASWRDEPTDLAGRVAGTDASALSPTDACPDNNARDEHGRLSLVDFEGAAFRPVAWDVAYLRVPWPSCWCSWQIPDPVADHAVERYQAAL